MKNKSIYPTFWEKQRYILCSGWEDETCIKFLWGNIITLWENGWDFKNQPPVEFQERLIAILRLSPATAKIPDRFPLVKVVCPAAPENMQVPVL